MSEDPRSDHELKKQQDDLKSKIEERKAELHARLDELKDDDSVEAKAKKKAARERIVELEKELEHGWQNMSDAVKSRLNKWLKR